MRTTTSLLTFAAAFLVLALTSFQGVGAGPSDLPSLRNRPAPSVPGSVQSTGIGDVLENPEDFQNREVTLSGAFRGWSGKCEGSWMSTRSDWVLEDETGCIFVSGILPAGLSTAKPAGEQVRVTGSLQANPSGKILLKASSAKVEKE